MFQALTLYERKLEMKRKEKFAGNDPHVRITKKNFSSKCAMQGVVARLVEARLEEQLTREQISQENNKHYEMFKRVLALFWERIEEAEKLCKEAGGKYEARRWCLADSQFKAGANPRVVGKIILGSNGETAQYVDFSTASSRKLPYTPKTTTPFPGGKGKAPLPEVRVPMVLADDDDSDDEDMGIGWGRGNKHAAPEAAAMAAAKKE
eukprot:gene33404-42847_t